MAEAEEEFADGIAYTMFAYLKFKAVNTLLRHCENRLKERVKEMEQVETISRNG